jgi:hypothetical protein
MTTRRFPLPHRTLGLLAGVLPLPLLLAGVAPATACQAAPCPYSVEVLVDGQPLTTYAARGTTYIEALRGREYAIRLRNNTGRRVAVALSVDGLNSIDAKSTTARDASKWVLGPWETAVIGGWQTSSDHARRFFFTSEEKSYGAWLGKTDDLGVISAAFFREVEPPRPLARRVQPMAPEADAGSRRRNEAPAAGAAQGAPTENKAERQAESAAKDQAALSDEYAATGIGRQVDAPVYSVDVKLERNPAATVSIRYEYRDVLVRLGVLPAPQPTPDPLARRERARGFQEFAPDPYR